MCWFRELVSHGIETKACPSSGSTHGERAHDAADAQNYDGEVDDGVKRGGCPIHSVAQPTEAFEPPKRSLDDVPLWLGWFEWDLTESLEPGPMALVLERVTLAPGAVLPAPPVGALRVMTSGLTVVYLPKASDGSISNLLKEPVVVYALTLLPAGSAAGTPEATPNGTD